MADATETKIDDAIADAAAEKAYAAAAEAVEAKPVEAKPVVAELVAAKPAPAKVAKPAKVKPTAPAAPAAVAKPVAAKVAKSTASKPAIKKLPANTAAEIKKVAPKKPAPKSIVKPAAKTALKLPSLSKIKDTIMAKTTTEDFTAKVTEAVSDIQVRAKAAYEKGTAVFGDVNEFTKGNVEAAVEAGKVLVAGLQDMGKEYVADSKSALETLTADFKELAAVKSPADFFKLQGEILRRNFDAAVATGSKRSEAVVKVAGDAYAPLSTRVSLAIEKVKQAA